MIGRIIFWSVNNRPLILLASVVLLMVGVYSLQKTPVDAIPDLSDVQVIVKTRYPGQAPQVVQDQVTYPLTSAMLAVPGAKTVRGFSFFGDSFVYVLFEEGTDLYWARSRVLEYLNQVSGQLPETARTELGPDATGVGWVFNYALVDRTGKHDLEALTRLQNWFLKYELQAVAGVSEVATIGGMDRQYQVEVDPNRLRAYGVPLAQVVTAIRRANAEAGASVVEMAEAEYMVRTTGYIETLADLQAVPLGVSDDGTALSLDDIADIKLVPTMRRGIAELNGEGEVVGGIVVMRSGENAAGVIARVKDKISDLEASLPEGVEIVTTYDRSRLIYAAVKNLYQKLGEEFLVVVLVCALFLFHLRSALVVLVSLPLGILASFIIMKGQGINANIMSLGGVAIAIGAMVDGAVVMIENLHRHLEEHSGEKLTGEARWRLVANSAVEVGPALFFSLLIITASFLPVFALGAQEGKLFSPLAYTKTYAMACAAGLAITLVPVLLGYFVRGKIVPERRNPINRLLIASYRPLLSLVLRFPKLTLLATVIIMAVGLYPATKLGSEFMPPLDEGDLMYMPTTYAGLSIGEARQILQQTDKLIKTIPEVATVFGKIGRADTATDPAPLTMIETVIQFKPQDQWRAGVDMKQIKRELNQRINFPGLTNAWVMPIKTRIDMLSTGIKTPVGIKIAGPDLSVINRLGTELESLLQDVEGTASAYAERVAGGRYINIDIQRDQAARYGLNIADVQAVVRAAIGGEMITQTVQGEARYPVSMRFPQSYRDSPEQIAGLPIVTPTGVTLALEDIADVAVEDGPPMIKSENARLNGWVFVDTNTSDIGGFVARAQAHVEQQLELPPGYSLNWGGQFEYMQRAAERLTLVVPITLAVIVLLLYLNFRQFTPVLIILVTLPFSLIGGIALMSLLGFNWSVAVAMGFIALAGVAVEIGVLMLVYLDLSYRDACQKSGSLTPQQVMEAVREGALRRLRPIVMTAATLFAGLLPILVSTGSGAQIMQRIAAPMIGGTISTLLLTLLVLPAVYLLWRRRTLDV
ncbi:CusA/CzcA family heavy metal efflux RND transporter [Gilvimarinus sp. SDUM040013]|uniref:CusA/CzcA family heavy metal efflux RND transporter n=1 Tax=Gilvimarinus gilvus TaxID=3058038 RepID=A0ABU4S1W9_9GAMM|nr:CusA/CzcA family heavy metal efflux RND transporter [Gilvimarinus sp. SDUM040013]MDO3386083.1 CusA/CzcA family heavy metal efflux RND transporter [Gilvimarinus sp. SDUM040013]MDX6850376.1 CusA/CzcA family heavy metal efflux RND transporter [Gilvimarinus sp. SDUM040013]